MESPESVSGNESGNFDCNVCITYFKNEIALSLTHCYDIHGTIVVMGKTNHKLQLERTSYLTNNKIFYIFEQSQSYIKREAYNTTH